MNIFLVEDNQNILEGLTFSLKENNYNVESVSNIKDTIKYLNNNIPDLIILDVSLPDGNGFSLYENVIKDRNIPTIFLTAKTGENDIVRGLELGADDYLTKPFGTNELLARIKKILLRTKKDNIITIKNITFDIENMKVMKDNKEITFTALELNILNLLLLNKGNILKREVILDKIWELTGNDVDDHTVTVYIKRIKDKLGEDIITTVKGIGYKIDE